MRTILFTGKGGVGKTTVAAATALACSEAGFRTAVMSTDPAHSLADGFAVELGTAMTEVAPRCFATQLDATERMESSWGEIREYLREVFNWAGLDEVEAEELSVIPGLDEIFALTDITSFERSGEWDVLIVDCAPTAETIRFLSLPDIISWYMDRVFPLGRQVTRLVGPMVSRLANVPVAGDQVFGAAERMYHQLDGVREMLRDGGRSTVRLVVNPEKMVVAEARRTFTYLSLFGYRVDAVIVNRLLPDVIDDPWFDQWKRTQAMHVDAIVEGFQPIPILRAELADQEIIGVDRLSDFAASFYGGHRPESVLFEGEVMRVVPEEAGLSLVLELPFAARHELEVTRTDNELFIRVGPYRRSVLLPDSLSRREITTATLSEGMLRVLFV